MNIEYCPLKKYELIRNEIKTGDLLLCSGKGLFSELIQDFTGSDWSHIGLIIRIPILDIIMVSESMEGIGVRLYPLSKYLQYYQGEIAIFRNQKFVEKLEDKTNTEKLFRIVFEKLGDKYDISEIFRIAKRLILKKLGITKLFNLKNKIVSNSKEICSEFLAFIFIKFNIAPPFSGLGIITPADFARWKDLEFLYRIK